MIVLKIKMTHITDLPHELVEIILWFLPKRALLNAMDASRMFLPAPKDFKARIWTVDDVIDLCREGYLNGLKIIFNKQPLSSFLNFSGENNVYNTLFSPEKSINNAYAEAAKAGHLDIIKFFYANGATFNALTLNAASLNGHLNIVKFLVSLGVYAELALKWAYLKNHAEIIEFLQSKGYENHQYMPRSQRIVVVAWKTRLGIL
jgi:hypothetical protein